MEEFRRHRHIYNLYDQLWELADSGQMDQDDRVMARDFTILLRYAQDFGLGVPPPDATLREILRKFDPTDESEGIAHYTLSKLRHITDEDKEAFYTWLRLEIARIDGPAPAVGGHRRTRKSRRANRKSRRANMKSRRANMKSRRQWKSRY